VSILPFWDQKEEMNEIDGCIFSAYINMLLDVEILPNQ